MRSTPAAMTATSHVVPAPRMAPVALAIRTALAASVAIVALAPVAGLAQVRPTAVHDLTRIAAHAPPVAQSGAGDIVVVNTDDITTAGASDEAAISVDAGGLASVTNSGALTVTSTAATADGIFATGLDVDVVNGGDIAVQGDLWAAGIEAQGYATTTVNNTAAIDAVANAYSFGINASGGPGSVSVVNSGVITTGGYYTTGIDVAAGTDAYVRNDGAINAGVNGAAVSTGIHVTSQYDGGAITVVNNGDIVAAAQYIATGIEVVGSGVGGTADVTNNANVVALTYSNYTTTGIAASADGDSTVTNLGSVYAAGGGDSEGIVSTTFGGTASILNGGDITVQAGNYATGIAAVANGGIASVDNQGLVLAYGGARSYGVNAQGLYGTIVNNDSTIYATANGAYAVQALSGAGDIQITNGTDGQIIGYGGGVGVGVFAIATQGDIAVDNAGLVAGVGLGAIGAGGFVRANVGDITVANTGTIEGISYYDALGLRAIADAGDVQVNNGGSLIASAGYGNATALGVDALGTAAIANTGTINATAIAGNAYAALATGATVGIVSNGDVTADAAQGVGVGLYGIGDTVSIVNGGSIGASGLFGIGTYSNSVTAATMLNTGGVTASGTYAIGIGGRSQGTLAVENRGTVGALGDASAIAFGLQGDGDVSLLNNGIVHVDATGDAIGAQVTGAASVIVENRTGSMHVTGGTSSVGLYGAGDGATTVLNGATLLVDSSDGSATGLVGDGFSTVTARNSGSLTVNGATDATGIVAVGNGATTVLNLGTIASTATGGEAVGIFAASGTGITIDNRKVVTATSDTSAVAVDFATAGTLLNSGTLEAVSSTDGAIAVRGGAGVQDVRNSGTLLGAVALGAGDDRFTNLSGGNWFIDGASSDFGSGDDVLANNAGGTITFRGGELHLGSSSTGNSFTNLGTLRVEDTGLIDMGTGATAGSANARAFTNGGLVDMVDGATDDTLTVTGDLGGTGRLAIDMALDGSAADHLVVNGNVATSTQQTVDLQFSGLPTTIIAPVEFARVSGTSTDAAFVGGQVLGYDPKDFLDLRVAVTSSISTSNATPDIFSVGLDVAGLNATGALAANVAVGAHSMMASEVGRWRERMGLDPSRDGRVGLGAWVRTFGDRGRLAPTNTGATMGSSGDLAVDQHNHGHEFGADVYFGRGVHAGLLLGETDGTQTLRDGGGTDRLHADASGLYGTWFGANGTYVDASYRWLAFDARIATGAGLQHARGDGHVANVEAGYGGLTFGGFRMTPQVQFTQSRVGALTVNGAQATFTSGGSTSNRARVGLEFSRDIGLGAWSLTPYASVSAVHEFDGRSRYSVNGLFNGETSTEGTSAMLDLGLAAQYRGLVFGTAVKWTDGGALENVVGGQVVLRYTW